MGNAEPTLATAALKFALKPSAVSTVIPGIRNVQQAEMNIAVSDAPPLCPSLVATMLVVPAASAVTSPAAVTDATAGDELLHVTARPLSTLLFASLSVAVSVPVR